MNTKKFLSLAMIYLIISLTFLSSLALAEIYTASAQGKDNAPGIIRSTDTLTFNSTSTMPCSVDYKSNGSSSAMNCDSALPVSCSYTAQVNNISGKLTTTIKESGSNAEKAIDLYVDNIAPVIKTLAVTSLGWGVKADYTITDSANTAYPDKCSGIEKVELVLNGKIVSTMNYPAGNCSITSYITGTIANYNGTVNVSINAYDYVEQKANKTASAVSVQSKPPKISSTAKVYRTGTADEVKAISLNSTNPRIVDIEVTADDESIPSDGAKGNFSMLLKENSTGQSDVAGNCLEINDSKYSCVFSGLRLLPNSTTPTINITITDSSGNIAKQSIKLTFTNVLNAGTVSSIGPSGTNCLNNNKCYVKGGNAEIIALISSSSTFYDNKITINNAAANCEKNTTWKCTANVNINEADTKLMLSGEDDLGNKISSEAKIIVDAAAPQIISVGIAPGSNTKTMDDLLKGDSIKINVSLKDATPIRAEADFTIIGGNIAQGSCTQTSNVTKTYLCKWDALLQIEGYFAASIPITITDSVNQSTTTNVEVVIKQLSDETPELWTNTVKISPNRINNRLLLYYPKEVFSKITLTPSGDARIRDLALGSCVPKTYNIGSTNTTYALTTLTLKKISMSDDKRNIVASVEVPAGLYNISTLEWNCSLSLKTQTNDKVYSASEIESFALKITIDSSKLMSDNVNEEIKIIQDDLDGGFNKVIREADKWVRWITDACGALKSLDVVATAFTTTETTLASNPVTLPAANAPAKAADATKLSQKGISLILKICDAVSCSEDWNKVLVKGIAKMPGVSELNDVMDKYSAGLGGTSNGSAATTIMSGLNPQESFAAAVITLCPSGILHNAKKLQTMKCEKLRCLQNDVPAGLSPTECERMYKYNKCMYWTGNLDAIPWLNIVSYVLDEIKSIISDPLALGGGILLAGACVVFPGGLHAICIMPKILDTLNKITTLYSAGKSLISSIGKFTNSQTGATATEQDICEQIAARSSYLDLPYDIRSGKANGGCINGLGCTDKDSEMFMDLNGEWRTIKTESDKLNNNYLIIQTTQALLTTNNQKIEELENKINNNDKTLPGFSESSLLINLQKQYTDYHKKNNQIIKQVKEKLDLVNEELAYLGLTLDKKSLEEYAKEHNMDIETLQKSLVENHYAALGEQYKKYYSKMMPASFKEDDIFRQNYMMHAQLSQISCGKGACTVSPELASFVKAISSDEFKDFLNSGKTAEEYAVEFDAYPATTATPDMEHIYEADKNDYVLAAMKADAIGSQGKNDLNNLLKNLDDIGILDKIKNCNKPCSLSDADGKLSKELNTAIEGYAKELEIAQSKAYWSGWQAVRSAAAFARSVHYLSASLFPDGVWNDYSLAVTNAWDSTFGMLDVKKHITKAICDSNVDQPVTMDGYIQGRADNGLAYTAAHIEAEAEPIINYSVEPPFNTGKYKYVVTAGLTNGHPSGRPLEFAIWLDSGSKVLQEQTIINESESFRLNNGAGVIFDDAIKYNRACIVFYSEPIKDYFDTVIDLDNNMLCNQVQFYDAPLI